MAHESQEVADKLWPPHLEHIFIKIMLKEQIKGNMKNGVFKGPMWQSMTKELNERINKNFLIKKVIQKHNRLRLKQRKWSQLLKHTGLGWERSPKQLLVLTRFEHMWWRYVIYFISYLMVNFYALALL